MKKTVKKKLNLKSETVKALTDRQMQGANGGVWTQGPFTGSRTCSVAEEATCNCVTNIVTQCAQFCTTNPWTANCVPN
mgnify:CR=1 FL=1